jgi:hypothetical protein
VSRARRFLMTERRRCTRGVPSGKSLRSQYTGTILQKGKERGVYASVIASLQGSNQATATATRCHGHVLLRLGYSHLSTIPAHATLHLCPTIPRPRQWLMLPYNIYVYKVTCPS